MKTEINQHNGVVSKIQTKTIKVQFDDAFGKAEQLIAFAGDCMLGLVRKAKAEADDYSMGWPTLGKSNHA